jgi:hypothetical protein
MAFLEEDTSDFVSGHTAPLIPQSNDEPPISVSYARRRLYGMFPDVEPTRTKRLIFRLLLDLEGEELDSAAEGFLKGLMGTQSFRRSVQRLGNHHLMQEYESVLEEAKQASPLVTDHLSKTEIEKPSHQRAGSKAGIRSRRARNKA